MCHGNPGVGRSRDSRGDPGHDLERDSRFGKKLEFLPAASKDEGIPAFQPDDHRPGLGTFDHQSVGDQLTRVFLARFLAHEDLLGLGRLVEQLSSDEPVVQKDVTGPKQLETHAR